jgi:hypothetical protein
MLYLESVEHLDFLFIFNFLGVLTQDPSLKKG